MTKIILVNTGEIILEKPFKEYQAKTSYQYIMKVSAKDFEQTKTELSNRKFRFSEFEGGFKLNQSDIGPVQTIMVNENIEILELAPIKDNLEAQILHSLQTGGRE